MGVFAYGENDQNKAINKLEIKPKLLFKNEILNDFIVITKKERNRPDAKITLNRVWALRGEKMEDLNLRWISNFSRRRVS